MHSKYVNRDSHSSRLLKYSVANPSRHFTQSARFCPQLSRMFLIASNNSCWREGSDNRVSPAASGGCCTSGINRGSMVTYLALRFDLSGQLGFSGELGGLI